MLTFKGLAKSGPIRKVLIKGRGEEIFSKFRPPHPMRAPESVRAPPGFFIDSLNTVAAKRCFTVKKTVAPDQKRLKNSLPFLTVIGY